MPAHRIGFPNGGQELKTVHYEPRDNIKELLPRTGPTLIRAWNHSNGIKKPRNASRSGDAADKEEPS
jgi:hypothetical protein